MTRFARDPLYRRHRFPAEVIAHAVWLYFRFPLSLRMVEDMLAAVASSSLTRPCGSGLRNSADTLPMIFGSDQPAGWATNGTSTRLSSPSVEKKHWLWRAVDQDGFVLDVLVQSRRNAKAAKRLMRNF
ncbi:DDE domain family protein (plasmid) [Rhizobium leguminosarum]|uniref:DDE domain family protein n=1 Tax=Rhizobium leguminosarum TaxID=384 RepID=A0A2Z4YUL1_RHILE|nr:DDE domain family protein [Rhizobium leguminosarum]